MSATAAPPADTRADARPRAGFTVWMIAGAALAVVLAFASLLVGTTDLATSWNALRGGAPAESVVLWDIRLPRAIGAWCAGALLGLAGALAQGLFRNPLADPYLLGSASGAALGVALAVIALGGAAAGTPSSIGIDIGAAIGPTLAAFIGAWAAIALTLLLARGATATATLLLGGIVVAFLLTAVTSLVLLAHPDAWRAMQSFLLGTTALVGWTSASALAITFAVVLVPALALARGLDALALGEPTARSLGVPVGALRLALVALIAAATAMTVAQVGVVSFVGLVAPHLVRQSAALDHRRLLAASALAGGALLQLADLASRWLIRPEELPVGAITAVLGGAYLVALMWRRARDA